MNNNTDNVLEHELLQQVYDRVVGNTDKENFPPIIPQLYYAINDLKTGTTDNNSDLEKKKADIDSNIPITSYDEEETGTANIHTGTKNLESLTAPIRYRIKVSKKIFEDEFKRKQEGSDDLYLHDLLKTDVTSWTMRISEMEEELKHKEEKLSAIKNKIKDIL